VVIHRATLARTAECQQGESTKVPNQNGLRAGRVTRSTNLILKQAC
jgi:hypothetical protein